MSEEIDDYLRERFKLFTETSERQTIAYNYLVGELAKEHGISEQGYKFLCWMSHNNDLKFPSKISKPTVPLPAELSILEFRNRFCTSEKRTKMFNDLINFVKEKMANFEVKSLKVIIGGSFLEDSTAPRDIDCLILIDKDILNKHFVTDFDYDRNCFCREGQVDAEFAVEDLSCRNFWYYSCVTHLGNKPNDKKALFLLNDTFKGRGIYSITVKTSTD